MIEYTGIDWIDARGATLAKMAESGHRLWVVEDLPPPGDWNGEVWEATATPRDTPYHLMGQWAERRISSLPRPSGRREAVFLEALNRRLPVALVVHDAGQLKGAVLDKMRLLAEDGALVVLVGDVCQIDLSTRRFPGFFQRATYCVQVGIVFK
jgi:hypothetical protein